MSDAQDRDQQADRVSETFIVRSKSKKTAEQLLSPAVVEAANEAAATTTDDVWALPAELNVPGDNTLHDVGEKIFFDRYAFKDGKKETLAVGDTVVVCVDLNTGQREIGVVQKLENGIVTVLLKDGTTTERAVEHVDKPLETKPEQMMERIARGIASAETTPEKQKEWEEKFQWLLDGWKFVPAGRILAGAGTNQKLTYYNCYVIPSPKDSREGIIKTLQNMNEIFSRGGGVGFNLSSLRPRYAYVKGVNGRSSGSVSWGSLYSFSTGLIEQGGSRRGALMLILNVWHPDITEFINSKRQAGKITNANISVGVTDDFMEAVEKDEDWNLVFPDVADPDYDEKWDGYLPNWLALGKKVITHKTVKARELWHNIIESAWASAEPGLFFIDRANKTSNSWYYSPLIATNPCGEQPLPGWAVCNLGAINLAKFIAQDNTGKNVVDYKKLGVALRYAVRFLDNIIDATPYFFDENLDQQKSERRVGLNTMGIAEMMIHLGIRYGSAESMKFINELYEFIATTTYEASTDLAAEKGAFPKFDADKFLESGFMQSMPAKTRELVRTKGMRNVTVLTQAPNGTIGTMVGTSTGIEPFYSWTYMRKSRLGLHEENVRVAGDWKKAHPGEELPEYFVNAMDLTPEEHVTVLAACQRWVDSAISKTSNTPNSYTVEQTAALYELMYKLGCKGGTIYRDGSRDEQILMLKKDDKKEEIKEHTEPHTEEAGNVIPRTRPDVLVGKTYRIRTGYGNLYITVNEDESGKPFEVFGTLGKAGGFFAGQAEAITRMASLALRSGIDVHEVIEQLKGIRGPQVSWSEGGMILSLPDAIGQILEKHIDSSQTQLSLEIDEVGDNQGVGDAEAAAEEELAKTAESNQSDIAKGEAAAAEATGLKVDAIHTIPTPKVAQTIAVNAKGKKQRSIADYGDAPVCPSCSTMLALGEGCLYCQGCGWSKCS
jgi:ribonucleoside-diphosphate reductase alpha chain